VRHFLINWRFFGSFKLCMVRRRACVRELPQEQER
jgi:hypothetical protein